MFDDEGDTRRSFEWAKFDREMKEYENERKKELKKMSPEKQLDYENAQERYVELARKEYCRIVQKSGKRVLEHGKLTDEEKAEQRECMAKTVKYKMKIEEGLRARGVTFPRMPSVEPDYFLRA
jgi:hypothetical protein